LMTIGMEFHIDYAHKLVGHPTCGVDHGHTARVLVEIRGEVKGGPSWRDNVIMDFNELKQIVWKHLSKLDHHNLNELMPVPSAENICKWIFDSLSSELDVVRVTFYEGEGKWCTVSK